MFRILRGAFRAANLYLMRRRQFDNLALRRYFSRNYDIHVGLYSYGCFDPWRMPGPMKVGRYCSFAGTVRSALRNHPLDALTTHPVLYEKAFGVVDTDRLEHGPPLVIEDDVWIGNNVVLLPGCKHIGRGAVIGAGSIVTRDVPAYAVMAGNPAQRLRDRFDPALAAAIEASRWWEMDLAELRILMRERPDLILHPSIEQMEDWRQAPKR
jgi:acetyltransferase-like isoleucine patch superfamily enzyme